MWKVHSNIVFITIDQGDLENEIQYVHQHLKKM